MDIKKDYVSESDIKELIDNLDKVVIPKQEDQLLITSNDWSSIDWDSDFLDLNNRLSISPLSTAQLAPLLTSGYSNISLTNATGAMSLNSGYNTITTSLNHPSWVNLKNTLEVTGDANFEGDIKIKGKSLSESLDNIEKRLAILKPNIELEARWEELKNLGERYRELEQQIISCESMFNTLKN